MSAPVITVVLAHPDDESFPVGGTLAKYTTEGVQVDLIMATRGEAGIPGRTAEEAAGIREAELRKACEELGVGDLVFLNLSDGHLPEEDEGLAIFRLVSLFQQRQPDVVITFGPEGISGHPDHIAVSHWTTMAFDRWQREASNASRLFYIAPSEATQQGCGVPPPAETLGGPVVFIDVGSHLVKKARAAMQHRSQDPPFSGSAEAIAEEMDCHEVFRLARPHKVSNGSGPLSDLFLEKQQLIHE
ncbi:MAG: PIG-L deacetylase family protein [Candidatus Promineifilaceae bacterium]